MKVSTILFVAILAGIGVSASKLCKHNPFKPTLKKKGVILLEAPSKTTSASCGDEWKTFGSCCDVPSLVQYSKHDTDTIMASVDGYVSTIGVLQQNLTRIIKQALSFTNPEIDALPNPVLREAIRYLANKETISFEMTLRNLFDEGKLRTQMNNCWKKMTISRSNSLCSICSARSPTFFEGENILIDLADCKSIVKDCAPAFKMMLKSMEVIDSFFQSFTRFLDPKEEKFNSFKEFLGHMKIKTEKIKSLHLHEIIAEYISQPESKSDSSAAKICLHFLTISGETPIQKLVYFLKMYSLDRVQRLVNIALERKAEQQSTSGNKKNSIEGRKNIRRLQASIEFFEQPKIDNFFSGDVTPVVKNTDNSYSSFYGAGGTTVTSHVGGKPFNITNKFP